jgi:hypothetical protein
MNGTAQAAPRRSKPASLSWRQERLRVAGRRHEMVSAAPALAANLRKELTAQLKISEQVA